MLYLIKNENPIENRDAIAKRFAEIGTIPPEGIKLVGQWFAGREGWSVVETDDMILLGKWLYKWSDLVDFQIIPVNTAEEVAKILAP